MGKKQPKLNIPQRIGVFGGTFNPIHKSHMYIARAFNSALSLDKILLIPTYIPPHKTAENLIDSEDRFNMCVLASEKEEYISVSDYEINKKGESYTYETLEWFSGEYLNAEFLLLMGSDMFLTFEGWRNPERIYELATLCVIAREPEEHRKLIQKKKELAKAGAKSIILQIDPKPMSSTEIRLLAKLGKPLEDYLDPKVIKYIAEKKLYL